MQQCGNGDLSFEAGERSADTVVSSPTKGEMLVRRAGDVKHVWGDELSFVAIG